MMTGRRWMKQNGIGDMVSPWVNVDTGVVSWLANRAIVPGTMLGEYCGETFQGKSTNAVDIAWVLSSDEVQYVSAAYRCSLYSDANDGVPNITHVGLAGSVSFKAIAKGQEVINAYGPTYLGREESVAWKMPQSYPQRFGPYDMSPFFFVFSLPMLCKGLAQVEMLTRLHTCIKAAMTQKGIYSQALSLLCAQPVQIDSSELKQLRKNMDSYTQSGDHKVKGYLDRQLAGGRDFILDTSQLRREDNSKTVIFIDAYKKLLDCLRVKKNFRKLRPVMQACLIGREYFNPIKMTLLLHSHAELLKAKSPVKKLQKKAELRAKQLCMTMMRGAQPVITQRQAYFKQATLLMQRIHKLQRCIRLADHYGVQLNFAPQKELIKHFIHLAAIHIVNRRENDRPELVWIHSQLFGAGDGHGMWNDPALQAHYAK